MPRSHRRCHCRSVIYLARREYTGRLGDKTLVLVGNRQVPVRRRDEGAKEGRRWKEEVECLGVEEA